MNRRSFVKTMFGGLLAAAGVKVATTNPQGRKRYSANMAFVGEVIPVDDLIGKHVEFRTVDGRLIRSRVISQRATAL